MEHSVSEVTLESRVTGCREGVPDRSRCTPVGSWVSEGVTTVLSSATLGVGRIGTRDSSRNSPPPSPRVSGRVHIPGGPAEEEEEKEETSSTSR